MWTFVILLVSVVVLIYGFVKNKYKYWKQLGVPYPEPTFFVGNIGQSLKGKKHLGQIFGEFYRRFENVPYIGFFKFLQPAVLLRDPELIKSVLVKDFNHFEKNDITAEELNDPITERTPFVLHGHKWKFTRGLITPNFTSGKMKNLFPLLLEVNDKFAKYVAGNSSEPQSMQILATKYTSENVANCAFGWEAKAFEKNESEFMRMATTFTNVSAIEFSKLTLVSVFPILRPIIRLRFFAQNVSEYLQSIVRETMNYRLSSQIKRNDVLDTLISFMADTKLQYPFKEIDVVAQAAGFLVDGVGTSSLVISYLFFELATNPDAQEIIKSEIDEVLERHGRITYEAVQEMHYLDCVVHESLRKHSPGLFLMKRSTKPYKMPPIPGNNKDVMIKENTTIIVPLDALHYDKKYFPEPEKFKPERFFKENKDKIANGTFIPFGLGPRVCLGMRFGLLQVKMAAIAAVKDFRLELNEKTRLPLKHEATQFMRVPEGGIWLNFIKRT